MTDVRASDLNHIAWFRSMVDESFLKGKLSLDLGCGSGYFCKYLNDKSKKTSLGIDLIEPKKDGESDFY